MTKRLLGIFLMMSAGVFAADRDFDRVVRGIESHYGAKRLHIPLMGVANFFVKVARPAGTSSIKLAVFENVDAGDDAPELDRFMDEFPLRGFHPMVRTHSRSQGESTYIYVGEAGKSTRLLIAVFQRREATLIEVTVNLDTLMRWMDAPERIGRTFLVSERR
jgi:hypothetical protein